MAQLQSIVEPEVEFMEVRLKMIPADVVMDSAHPVFQVEDVPMKRFEIGPLSTILHVMPLVNQGTQIALPPIGGYYSRGLNCFVERLFERLSRSIIDDSGSAPFQLPFLPCRLTVIDLDRDQNKTFFALAAPTFSFFSAAQKRLINLNVFNKLSAPLAGLHRQLNLALEKPRSLLVNVKLSGQLARTHALLRGGQKVNHGKGGGQREFDFVEQGVRSGRLIESAGSAASVVASAPSHGVRTSTATACKSIAPFLVRQIRFARIFAVKLSHEFNDCQRLFHGCLDLILQSKTATPQPICGVRSNPLIRYSDLENKTLTWLKSIFALNVLIHLLSISTFIGDLSHMEIRINGLGRHEL